MASKAEIKRDTRTNEVYVIDNNGNEVFRKPYSHQIVAIANSVYMSEKYKDKWNGE